MFDTMLRNDVLELSICYTIDDIQYNREQMKKIITCKTKDKLWLLNYLLDADVIDTILYKELLQRVKSDYKTALFYLLGLCKI